MTRWRAASIHLCISGFIALVVASLIFGAVVPAGVSACRWRERIDHGPDRRGSLCRSPADADHFPVGEWG